MNYESFQNLNSSQDEKTAKHHKQLNEDTDVEINIEINAETDAEINAEINTEINSDASDINSDASDTHINVSVDYNKTINDKMTKYVNTFI